MTGSHDRLTEVLDAYANFLREKGLALPKHQPYLVRWVKDFLLFAKEHVGYTFEQTLDLFLAEVQRLLARVEPEYALMVRLLYGSGLRYGHPRDPRAAGTQERRDNDDLHACRPR